MHDGTVVADSTVDGTPRDVREDDLPPAPGPPICLPRCQCNLVQPPPPPLLASEVLCGLARHVTCEPLQALLKDGSRLLCVRNLDHEAVDAAHCRSHRQAMPTC